MPAAWIRDDVHGNVEAKAAFGTVSIQNDGQFLVYLREADHVLCVVYRGKLTFHIIRPGADGTLTANKKVFGDSKNIDDLITALSAESPPGGWPVRLTTSPPRKGCGSAAAKPAAVEADVTQGSEPAATPVAADTDTYKAAMAEREAREKRDQEALAQATKIREEAMAHAAAPAPIKENSCNRKGISEFQTVALRETAAAPSHRLHGDAVMTSPPRARHWEVGKALKAADNAALHLTQSTYRQGTFNGTAAARDAQGALKASKEAEMPTASKEVDRLTAELAAQKAAYVELLSSSTAQMQQMNARMVQMQMQHQAELSHMAQQFRMEMERIQQSSKAGLHAQVHSPEKKGKSINRNRNSNSKLQQAAPQKQMSDAERRMLVKEAELTGRSSIKRTLSKEARSRTGGGSSNVVAVESGGVFLTRGGYVEREGRLADRD